MKPTHDIADYNRRMLKQLQRLLPNWHPQLYDRIIMDFKNGIQISLVMYHEGVTCLCCGVKIVKFETNLRTPEWTKHFNFDSERIPEKVAVHIVRMVRDALSKVKNANIV